MGFLLASGIHLLGPRQEAFSSTKQGAPVLFLKALQEIPHAYTSSPPTHLHQLLIGLPPHLSLHPLQPQEGPGDHLLSSPGPVLILDQFSICQEISWLLGQETLRISYPFFFFFLNLAAWGVSCSVRDHFQLWHVRSSSLTRDGAQAPVLGVQS